MLFCMKKIAAVIIIILSMTGCHSSMDANFEAQARLAAIQASLQKDPVEKKAEPVAALMFTSSERELTPQHIAQLETFIREHPHASSVIIMAGPAAAAPGAEQSAQVNLEAVQGGLARAQAIGAWLEIRAYPAEIIYRPGLPAGRVELRTLAAEFEPKTQLR